MVLATELANWFVVVMGLSVVFIGLIAIILIISLTGKIMSLFPEKKAVEKASPAPVSAGSAEIPNRPEFVAAVSAAIAEELGTEISKINIVSIKKL